MTHGVPRKQDRGARIWGEKRYIHNGMTKRWHVTATTLVLALAFCACGQHEPGSIRGLVRDSRTRDPISPASVTILATKTTAYTARDGSFLIRNVRPGHVTIKVTALWYPGRTIDRIRVEAGREKEVIVALENRRPELLPPPRPNPRRAPRSKTGLLVGSDVDVKSEDITCEIIPLKKVFHVGDTPQFRVVMHNQSDESIYLVSYMDGSGDNWRYPRISVMVSGPEGGVESPQGGVGCGTYNPLTPLDLVLVAPGSSFEPLESAYYPRFVKAKTRFARAGTFHVRFRYSSDEFDLSRWVANEDGVLDMLKRVPRFVIADSIAVEVVD